MFGRIQIATSVLAGAACASPGATSGPTFSKDIQPILEKHCQMCHRPGDIGPMPLTTWAETRPWASAIREAVKLRKMPPWFADPRFGTFANDPRLTDGEIATVEAWVQAGAAEGERDRSRRTPKPAESWRISPDLVIEMPRPFQIAANAVVDYQYVILPLPFTFERWVKAVEILPGDRSVVHHAVLYVRPPGSKWLAGVPKGVAWAPPRTDESARVQARQTTEDILAIYTPGSQASVCPGGMAKRIPAGSDLVLQLHYTSKRVAASDQSAIGLVMSPERPSKQILTLQMGRDDLRIPPGDANYHVSVSGTLPDDALLISLFPHMHLRGTAFDFDIAGANGEFEPLLHVKPFDFNWQLTYILKSPRLLAKGTRLRWTGYFDNSRNNPRNPDPSAEVVWGEQSFEEMMIGFFDVAVDPRVSKADFFSRR